MRRRRFFGALLAGAAAFVVAPTVKVEAAPSEDDEIRARVAEIMANPGKYPEIEARVSELRGLRYYALPDPPVPPAAYFDGSTGVGFYDTSLVSTSEYRLTVRNQGASGLLRIVNSDAALLFSIDGEGIIDHPEHLAGQPFPADDPTVLGLWFTDEAIKHGDGPTGWSREGGRIRFLHDGVEKMSWPDTASRRRSLHEGA